MLSSMRVLLVCCFFVLNVNADVLTLDNYLSLVSKNNSKLKSIQADIDAINGKLSKTEMIYSYYWDAGINYATDKSGRPFSLSNRLCEVKNLAYATSLSKIFAFGTQVCIGLNGSNTDNLFESNVNLKIIDMAPFIKLQQSLLKDINGGLTKVSIAKSEADAKSALYLLEYQEQSIFLGAKMAYWNLSYAKTIIDFRKNALNRLESILDWNQKRFNMDLVERVDLLQAQVAVKLGSLSLKNAYDQENKANRAVSQFLNTTDVTIQYDVEKFEEKSKVFNNECELIKDCTRLDVLASMEDVNSIVCDQIINKKTNGADLIINGQVALNGVEQNFESAKDSLANAQSPSYSLDIRYSLPLNFKLKKVLHQGYEASKIAAREKAKFLCIKEVNDWQQLLDDLNDAKVENILTREIERIQKQKKQEDNKLLEMGRTTTYLALQSEQALDDATLNVLRSTLELIKVYETAKTIYSYDYDIEIQRN